ncbi:unnamed protein product [Sphagnum troendelagicum]|uniref:Uncharacterized protein n=1 Tax=Sphagnum jensenii TaxID=128206 RepID=A0ABP0XJK1_9BRYO
MAHSLLGAECNLSVSAVLVRSSSSLIAELSSPTSEVLNSINKVQTEVVWQISILDDVKSDMEEVGGVELQHHSECQFGFRFKAMRRRHLSSYDYLHQAHRDQAANAATLTPMGMDGATCVPCRKCLALILRLANVAEPSTATELANSGLQGEMLVQLMAAGYVAKSHLPLRASCHFLMLDPPPPTTPQMLIQPVSGGLLGCSSEGS